MALSFNQLLEKHLAESLNAEERDVLQQMLEDDAYLPSLQQVIDEYAANKFFVGQDDAALKARSFQQLSRRLQELTGERTVLVPRVHRVHFLRSAWFRYAAAVILLIGIGGYFLWSNRGEVPALGENDKKDVVLSETSSSNRAILTLADGTQITLDNQQSGNIAQQGNTQIIKLNNNQLTYNSNFKKTSPPAMEGTVFDPREAGQKPGVGALYNTITTPRGSQYQVILPDGSKAWLNALSSLRFPVAFTGTTRTVEITGEAYLEIAKNTRQPFLLKAAGTEVQVLGTSFNINAYEDERSIKTTLIEGCVKVSTINSSELLRPGQQAQVDEKKSITIATGPAVVNQAIAWKEGVFNFEGLGLKEVMNQLQRWYDIEVVYEGNVPDITFYSKIYKTTRLSVMLEVLKSIGVSCRIEGKKLIVSQ